MNSSIALQPSLSGKKRNNVWCGAIEQTEDYCLVLVGTHAFCGNYYTSSFFKRGK